MTIPIRVLILIPIIVQSMLFALFLLNQKGSKVVSNRLLGVFLAALGFQMLVYLLMDIQSLSNTWLAGTGVVFAYGPLMYFYARSLIYQPFHFRPVDWLHFLPALLFILLMVLGIDMRSRFGWMLYLSLGIYLSLAFREINRFQKVIENTHSAPEHITLNWLKWSFGLFAILLSADLISFLINALPAWQVVNNTMDVIVLGLVLFFVNFLMYKGLKQPKIFQGIRSEESNLVPDASQLNKQLIAKNFSEEISLIQTFFDNEKPYLDPSLTIRDLADQLAIPMRRLSMIINGYFGQNFSEFINHYRIEAAKKRLEHPNDPGETILEVLYDVGFHSKSAFNTAFKKITGQTPTAYKKEVGGK